MPKENIQIVASPGAHDGLKVLHIKGPLTIHTLFDFQEAVRSANSLSLIVDFSGVPFIDSAGLGALVGAHVSAQKAQRKLAIAATNAKVKALMDMTHVSQLFPTFPTIKDAEAAIS